MARTINNCITRNASGKLGPLVLTRDGNMRFRPETSKRERSVARQEHLSRFERAMEYARKAISDPVLNAFYAQKAAHQFGLGAWHLAINDYCHPAEILRATFTQINESNECEILIGVYDKYQVTGVRISVISPDGIIAEEGEAGKCKFNYQWRYKLQTEIELVPGLTIVVKAIDLPGNITLENLVWPFECNKEIQFRGANIKGTSKKNQKSQLRVRDTSMLF